MHLNNFMKVLFFFTIKNRLFEPTALFANWANFLTKDSKRLYFTDQAEEGKCIV